VYGRTPLALVSSNSPASLLLLQSTGPVMGENGAERTFTTTKVLKLGEYQMKRLKNGDIYKVCRRPCPPPAPVCASLTAGRTEAAFCR
jgi:hypothetical protein